MKTRTIRDSIRRINQNYIDQVDDEELLYLLEQVRQAVDKRNLIGFRQRSGHCYAGEHEKCFASSLHKDRDMWIGCDCDCHQANC